MKASSQSGAGRAEYAAGLVRLAENIRALAGWRRAALAVLLGALATAALPPLHLVPLIVPAFVGLVWLIEGADGPRPIRRAFVDGWWFGVGHFATGLYWISHALLVDPVRFGWMIPFALFGLSAGLAVFPGLAALAVRFIRLRGLAAILVLAAAWGAVEWVRGHVLTGFPWNLIGTVWTETETVMQGAALVGLYGLGVLTVLVAALPATLGLKEHFLHRWAGPFAALILLGGLWGFGAVRLAGAEPGTVAGVRLRLVQPNIPQNLKWDSGLRERHVRHTMALTRTAGFEGRTHVVWPESAVPFALANSPALRQALATVVPRGGLLITGAPRVAEGDGPVEIWNSLHAIDDTGTIVGTYDKAHLVPFGEYVPLRGVLGALGLEKITPGPIDFSAGPGPQTLALPGLPAASPLICYEVIFPGHVVAADARPGWLLNVTNDAWFGISSGPYQHFASSRFRTVEEGLPLVRAANNGISAVVDAYGRVQAQLGLGRTGILDADLPKAIAPPLYARLGDVVPAALALFLLALAAVVRRLG